MSYLQTISHDCPDDFGSD